MRVRVEIVPGLTQAFGYRGTGRLVIEKTVADGTTLGDLLSALIEEHPEFREYALDGEDILVCPYVCVILNGEFVASPKDLGQVLRDGDVLVLMPEFVGG